MAIQNNIILKKVNSKIVRLINNKKKKTYSPEDIITKRYYMNRHIKTYNKIGLIRIVTGSIMIITGIATIPIPMTTIPLLIGGGAMLGYDVGNLLVRIKYELRLALMRFRHGNK